MWSHLFMLGFYDVKHTKISVFYQLHCNPKEKDHIWTKLKSKRKNICEISIIIIILICQKLESVGPAQQKIKLPSPKGVGKLLKHWLNVGVGRFSIYKSNQQDL